MQVDYDEDDDDDYYYNNKKKERKKWWGKTKENVVLLFGYRHDRKLIGLTVVCFACFIITYT